MTSSRLLTALLCSAAICASVMSCSHHESGPAAPRVVFSANQKTELLASRETPGLTIFYGSELFGSVDGCGCMGNPRLGGLPYRFGYTEGFRAAFPSEAVIQVDAGACFLDPRGADGAEIVDQVERNAWVLRAFERLGYDAINISQHDLPFLSRLGPANASAGLRTEFPAIDRFVSANVVALASAGYSPRPFVVRVVRASDGTEVRVAIVGVTEPPAASDSNSRYRIVDPLVALRQVLPDARAQSDVVVLLAYVSVAEWNRLQEKLADQVDVVIVANSLGTELPARLDGRPRVMYSWYKTQMLGELALGLDGRSVASATNRYVKMDEPVPRDPLCERIANDAVQAVERVRKERFAQEGVTVK